MFPEYRNMHSLAIQDVVHRVDKAFDNFFRRISERKNGKNIKAGFPRFKSRDRYSSITYTQSGFRILDNGHVWLSNALSTLCTTSCMARECRFLYSGNIFFISGISFCCDL